MATGVPVRTMHLVGIGLGHPDHLTLRAVDVLGAVDVVVLLHKPGPADDLTAARAALLDRFAPRARVVERPDPPRDRAAADAVAATERWREDRAALLEEVLVEEVADDGSCALLVWGDPAVYDGTTDVLDRIDRRGRVAVTWDVVPGISAPSALAAAHRTTLTRTGRPTTIAPARRVLEQATTFSEDLVVMLDGTTEHALERAPDDAVVFWGAYLGSPDEILVSGVVADVRDRILALRAEARRRKGWLMDTYLLRRA